MKLKFKKITAVIAAMATLSIGMTAVSANATDGSRTFSPNGTASLSVASTSVSASTSCRYTCSSIKAQITATYGGSITSGYTSKTAYGATSVTVTGWGTGFTKATSYHSLTQSTSGSSGSTTVTVTR